MAEEGLGGRVALFAHREDKGGGGGRAEGEGRGVRAESRLGRVEGASILLREGLWGVGVGRRFRVRVLFSRLHRRARGVLDGGRGEEEARDDDAGDDLEGEGDEDCEEGVVFPGVKVAGGGGTGVEVDGGGRLDCEYDGGEDDEEEDERFGDAARVEVSFEVEMSGDWTYLDRSITAHSRLNRLRGPNTPSELPRSASTAGIIERSSSSASSSPVSALPPAST